MPRATSRAVGAEDAHRVAAVKAPARRGDAGRQQAAALEQRAQRAGVDDERAGGRSVPAIHCLRAAAGVALGTNQVQRRALLDAPQRMRMRCRRRCTCGSRRATAMRAARILVAHAAGAERRTPSAPAMASISGVMWRTSRMKRGAGILVGIGGVQAIDVRQQHQAVGAGHLRHARRQPVVVAVADLGGRHRVVLVDDRQRARAPAAIRAWRARSGSGGAARCPRSVSSTCATVTSCPSSNSL